MSATPRQLDLIDQLIRERQVSDEFKTQIHEICMRPDASPTRGGEISRLIDGMFKLPKRGAGGERQLTQDEWLRDAGIPCGMYALETSALPAPVSVRYDTQEYIFVQVREYRETRYLRQLHGAPGSFSRTKISVADQRAIVTELCRAGYLRSTQLFGELYTCCGVCGAELTDDTSRALKLGPVCRGRFGL